MKLLFENWRKYMNEAEGQKPKLIFLVGPPAVGKSTWVRQNLSGDYHIINRDEMVNDIVGKEGSVGTYDATYVKPNNPP